MWISLKNMKNRATNPQSRQLIIIFPTFRWQFLVNFGVDHHFSPLSLAYLGIFWCHDCSVPLLLARSRPSIAADKGAALNFLIFGSCACQLHIGAPIYGYEIIENISHRIHGAAILMVTFTINIPPLC